MAQRGRKPKPTAVKVLEGNPGKRGLNAGEPKPEKKAPRCPAWLEAEEYFSEHGAIMETPSGYCQQVPQVSIAQTYLKIMNRFCEQFGLTPSSRSRIVADAGEDKESDVMEILLFKGGGG